MATTVRRTDMAILALAGAGLLWGLTVPLSKIGLDWLRAGRLGGAPVTGAAPRVLVAAIPVLGGRSAGSAAAWASSAAALAGVALVAVGGGGGSTLAGDGLVALSVAGSAVFIVVQPHLLGGRGAAAATAVQLAAAALLALPVAVVADAAPGAPAGAAPVAAVAALALAGTLAAYWLFAWAQARVPAHVASAFINLEPLVRALAGVAPL